MKPITVLRALRDVADDAKYPQYLEDLRQIGIWAQVKLRKQQLDQPFETAERNIKLLIKKNAEIAPYLKEYAQACQEVFIHNQDRGDFTDGTGDKYLQHCLGTFGGVW